jgi:phosphoadenosine phosphosulfate reductase
VVLVDLAARHAPSLRFLTLDTGRLPPETYEVMELVRKRYGLTIEVYSPQRDAVETLERGRGFFSFRESLEARRQCCDIRKTEPLRRALAGRSAWVSGIRRDQNVTRSDMPVAEFDRAHGLFKLNPLVSWSASDVWAYVKEKNLPYHRLYDAAYTSIGCAPCTRAVKPFEHPRAGRWWWESAEHKECGLHLKR